MGIDQYPGAERLHQIAGGLGAINRERFDRQIAFNLRAPSSLSTKESKRWVAKT
jgi:hypothetical protein